MKKKIMAALLAMCLFVGLTIPVFAAGSAAPWDNGTGGTAVVEGSGVRIKGDAALNSDVCYCGPFTNFGGYSNAFPTGGFKTSITINASALTDGQTFRWTTAINDTVGVGAYKSEINSAFQMINGELYFMSTTAVNPASPAVWLKKIADKSNFTIVCEFRNNNGKLECSTTVDGTKYTITNYADLCGDIATYGGNRYGWFCDVPNDTGVLVTSAPTIVNGTPAPPAPPTYNPPTAVAPPAQEPVLTPPTSGNGTTEAKYENLESKEIMTTGDKTIATSEIKLDTEVTDKATKESPVEIKTTIASKDAISAIENSLTEQVELKLVVPNAVETNENVTIQEIGVDKSVFEQAKKSGKTVTFAVETEDGKQIASWEFDGKDMKGEPTDVNLALNLTEPPQEIKDIAKNALVIDFNHSGDLPSTAKIKINIGDKYKDGDEIFLYYKNSKTGELELISKAVKVVNGFVEIEIDHCSEYVLTTAPVATDSTKNPTLPPKTGTADYAVIAFSVIAAAGLLLIAKKKLMF